MTTKTSLLVLWFLVQLVLRQYPKGRARIIAPNLKPLGVLLDFRLKPTSGDGTSRNDDDVADVILLACSGL